MNKEPEITSKDESTDPAQPTFTEWYDSRYEDDGDCGGHISDRMVRRWIYDNLFKKDK